MRPKLLDRPVVRTVAAFWLFGFINNVLYVIILSAALDLVGANVPKGLVLLADVVPSFIVKLVAPYFIHLAGYGTRVCCFVALSVAGMLLLAASPATHDAGAVATKLLAIAIASTSCGGGELSFLGLTHYYGRPSLAAWGSGTGFAGLGGAGAYVLATVTLRFSPRASIFAFAFLPVVMLASYFAILPAAAAATAAAQYSQVSSDADADSSAQHADLRAEEREGLLHEPPSATLPTDILAFPTFKDNLRKAKVLIIPFMLPLFLVYIAEYTINQGVAPTLLFPLQSSPFSHFRDFYPTYAALYQLGVFISRTSIAFLRVHHLYTPSILQLVNLAVLALHALFDFLPTVWLVFAIVFWEGLLGGLVYVNAFAEISDAVPEADREFSLSVAAVSDSGGICVAALLSMVVEKGLCAWQVSRGRDWCRRLE